MSSLNILLICKDGKTKDAIIRVLLYLLFLIRVSKINSTLERLLAGLNKKGTNALFDNWGREDALVNTEQSIHTEEDIQWIDCSRQAVKTKAAK